MSDGFSDFPSSAVDRHINCTTFKDKIDFYAVGFGSTSSVLRDIADKMPNGKVVDAPTAKELTISL